MSVTRRKQNKLQYYVPISVFTVVILIVLSFSYNEIWFFNWEGIRPQIKDSISEDNYIHIFKRRADLDPKIVNKRVWLISYANDYELLRLTKFPNGNVKAVAYEGLLKSKTYKDKYQLILGSFNVNEDVRYFSICVGYDLKLRDYLMGYILGLKKTQFPTDNILDYGLSNEEKEKLVLAYNKIETKLD